MIDLDALTANAPAADTTDGPYTVHHVASTRYAEIHATKADRTIAMNVPIEVAALLAAAPALVAELRRMRVELDGTETTVIRQATILTRVANALKGASPPLARHSTHDVGEIAESIRDALRVRNDPSKPLADLVLDTVVALDDALDDAKSTASENKCERMVADGMAVQRDEARNALLALETSISQVLDAAGAPSVMHTLAGRVEAIVADRDNLAKVVSEEAAQRKRWRDEIAREIPDAPATWTPGDIAYALARMTEERDSLKAKNAPPCYGNVSLFGHKNLGVCRVEEATFGGTTMLRCTTMCDETPAVHWTQASAVYCLREMTETEANDAAKRAADTRETNRRLREEREAAEREMAQRRRENRSGTRVVVTRCGRYADVRVTRGDEYVADLIDPTLPEVRAALAEFKVGATGSYDIHEDVAGPNTRKHVGTTFGGVDEDGIARLTLALLSIGFSGVERAPDASEDDRDENSDIPW